MLTSIFPFLCRHKFSDLYIEKPQTIKYADEVFDHITYHIHCGCCGKKLEIKAATFRGGLENYMNKERAKVGLPPTPTGFGL